MFAEPQRPSQLCYLLSLSWCLHFEHIVQSHQCLEWTRVFSSVHSKRQAMPYNTQL